MTVRNKSAAWPGVVLLLAMLVAAIGGVLLLLVLWKYVPARAAEFACTAQPLPRITAAVFYVAKWTIRLLPFFIVLGAPLLGAAALGVVALALTAGRNALWARRATIALAVLIAMETAAAALIFHATRPPHGHLERVCTSSFGCHGRT